MPVIISVKPDSKRGRTKVDNDGKPTKEYAVKYTVRGDTQNDDPDIIKLTPGIPVPGVTSLNYMTCKSTEAVEVHTFARWPNGEYSLWEVESIFDSKMKKFDDRTDENGNPLPAQDWTPDWSWDYEEIQEIVEQSYEYDPITHPIVNALGEQILIEAPVVIPVLTIRRYQVAFDPNIQFTYGNRVNEDDFWGAPPGTALMMPPRDQVSDQSNPITGQALRMVEYTIKFSNRNAAPNSYRLDANNQWELVTGIIGWRSNPLAKAKRWYPASGGDPDFPLVSNGSFPFLDSRTGQPTEGLIRYRGTRLITDDDFTDVAPHYYVFQPFKSATFGDLDLGPY